MALFSAYGTYKKHAQTLASDTTNTTDASSESASDCISNLFCPPHSPSSPTVTSH